MTRYTITLQGPELCCNWLPCDWGAFLWLPWRCQAVAKRGFFFNFFFCFWLNKLLRFTHTDTHNEIMCFWTVELVKHDAVCAAEVKLLCHNSPFRVKGRKVSNTDQGSLGKTTLVILPQIEFLLFVYRCETWCYSSQSHTVMCCLTESQIRIWTQAAMSRVRSLKTPASDSAIQSNAHTGTINLFLVIMLLSPITNTQTHLC